MEEDVGGRGWDENDVNTALVCNSEKFKKPNQMEKKSLKQQQKNQV